MREAIDQFHREALAGANYQPTQGGAGLSTAQQEQAPRLPPNQNQPGGGGGVNVFGDPRVRVMITDQTIFTTE